MTKFGAGRGSDTEGAGARMSRPTSSAAQGQKFPVVIGVTGGTFYCHHCGARWVGTWRGDPALMTCRWCDHPMNGDDDAAE
jgi:hypothetical protein